MAITLLFPIWISAQNLEKIGKKDMVTIGGGMNFNSVFYDAQGFPARRDPYTWYFNGNLNINILDVSLPFTYSYSNLHGTYTQPFNMQSCSPKYKWATAHVGTTAMNFSTYTLAGHIFTGAGIELRPNGFYFGAMYGRLNKAIPYNLENSSSETMSYKRMGLAGKVGFDKGENSICVSYFTAKDDPATLLFIPPESTISPAQNTAISVAGKTKFLKFFSAEGEYAISGLTRNINSEIESTDFNGFEKFLLPTKSTTQFFRAYKVAVGYANKTFALKINHEHVDSDYQTFGAYYFNNDLENWTIAPSLKLLKGKLSLAVNTGWQHNNLDGTKLNTAHRWVGSASVNFTPNKNWIITSSYSNFTTFTNRRLQSDPFWQASPADTLSFYQIAQQSNCNVVHSFGKKKLKQSVSLIGSFQLTGMQQNLLIQSNSKVVTGNLSYSIQFVKTKTSVSIISNYNRSESEMVLTEMFGPGFQCSQSLLNGAIRIAGGSSYNQSYSNSILTSNILSHRAQFSYSPKLKNKLYGKPSFSINAIFVNRFPTIASQSISGELTVTANLGLNF